MPKERLREEFFLRCKVGELSVQSLGGVLLFPVFLLLPCLPHPIQIAILKNRLCSCASSKNFHNMHHTSGRLVVDTSVFNLAV